MVTTAAVTSERTDKSCMPFIFSISITQDRSKTYAFVNAKVNSQTTSRLGCPSQILELPVFEAGREEQRDRAKNKE